MSKMPAQRPGRSEQVVATPPEFLQAVKKRLQIDQFDWDLAADEANSVVPSNFGKRHYDENDDALIQPWKRGSGWNWCNPPYGDIEPWVQKAWIEASNGAQTVMLVPASTGSNWWRDHVSARAYISHLNGRLTFVGHKSPYPKDLALLLYTPWGFWGTETWNWRANL
jgi:phage N-6-adenine-methyltransferase